ncbi:MAG TPA: Calx-beta domain-containing protein, partial [Acidimicrobiales bacterium]|nr:Calx-beta domain-containing protein [Acidimicrobiales bacterium]
EGNSGTTAATFTITRSGNTNGETKVKYATKTAPSASANDFAAVPLTEVTFAPGETTKTVTVDVIGDTVKEKNERFSLALSGAVGATFQDATGTALIINDD